MPTYEYTCAKCEHHFEFSQSMKDPVLAVCPKDQCGMKRWGKGKVKRGVGGGAGLIFKGSGFYITDYRSDKYKEAAKKDVPAAAPAATPATSSTAPATASAKSEAKPAAAPKSS